MTPAILQGPSSRLGSRLRFCRSSPATSLAPIHVAILARSGIMPDAAFNTDLAVSLLLNYRFPLLEVPIK
jgi:hypothetical protein